MAITRALMNRQMYNMGGPALEAGAPDLRLTGDQRHRGTYTQRRARQMAAGGGIMGSNAGSMLVAPTADGSRPGYWGIPDWISDPIGTIKKVGQTIIPGGETGYFDLYGDAGEVAKKVGQTIIPGGETGYGDIYGATGDVIKKVGETIIPGGEPGYGDIYGATGDVIKKVGETIIPGGEKGYFDLYGGIADLLPYLTNQNLASNFDWGKLGEKYLSQFGPAVAGGLLAGKMQQDYLDRQPAFPEDQTSINFQTAQEAMDDPNLRFKPKLEDTQLAADGGRIGYSIGGRGQKDVVTSWNDYVNSGGRREFESWFRDVFLPSAQGLEGMNIIDNMIVDSPLPKLPWELKDDRVVVAQGGRIGFANGSEGVNQMYMSDEAGVIPKKGNQGITKEDVGLKRKDFDADENYERYLRQQNKKAQGGRIGFNSGGFSAGDLLVLRQHKYNPSEVAKWKDGGRDLLKTLKGFYTLKAKGGRIGYAKGLGPVLDQPEDNLTTLEFMQDQGIPYGQMAEFKPVGIEKLIEPIYKKLREQGMSHEEAVKEIFKMLQGKARGKKSGVMMASAVGDESDDIATQLFGKTVKELNPSEMQELQDEIDRLQNKFRSKKDSKNGIMMASEPGMGDGPFMLEEFLEAVKKGYKGTYDDFINDIDRSPADYMGAKGGRVPAQEGGLMDLGGMEKDYRQEGGFVPIGGEEKADDVPARLSKNEFVFTADAVRSAGGGDIDQGAAVMERLMENLEAGGKVSEESQGLEGAREMFATTQRLEKRIA